MTFAAQDPSRPVRDAERSLAALAAIGENPAARAIMVAALRDIEGTLARRDYNVREEVTGPLVDVLHTDVDSLDVRLQSGVTFELPYRSKIARDLALRETAMPDHIFEPQTTRMLLHLARNAKNVLIGGAYAGDHAVPLGASLRGSSAIIHTFEPNSQLRAAMMRNAAANGLSNIRYNPEGLWDKADVSLHLVNHDAWARVEEVAPDHPDALPCTTIDGYCRRESITDLDVIMLDIEGAELRALQGAAGMLARPHAPHIIYEVNRGYVDWTHGLEKTDLVALLSDFGYTSFCVRDYQSNVEMHNAPVELVPVDDVYLEGPPHGFNMLAVKDVRVVTEDPMFCVVPGVSPKLLAHRDPKLHAPRNATPLLAR